MGITLLDLPVKLELNIKVDCRIIIGRILGFIYEMSHRPFNFALHGDMSRSSFVHLRS